MTNDRWVTHDEAARLFHGALDRRNEEFYRGRRLAVVDGVLLSAPDPLRLGPVWQWNPYGSVSPASPAYWGAYWPRRDLKLPPKLTEGST